MGTRVVHICELQPRNNRLLAAKGNSVPLLGKTTVQFRVRNTGCSVDVAETVEEIILGIASYAKYSLRVWIGHSHLSGPSHNSRH